MSDEALLPPEYDGEGFCPYCGEALWSAGNPMTAGRAELEVGCPPCGLIWPVEGGPSSAHHDGRWLRDHPAAIAAFCEAIDRAEAMERRRSGDGG